MRDFTIYLKDILTAIESIEGFISGMDLDAFESDDKTTSAVLRKLEIIGEAVKQIPDEIRQKHSHVPWKEMAGMRDKLIHFYFGVDNHLVWKAITKRLPHVKQEIEKVLQEAG
jgi:uncharacterized protein with HEPN domain